MAGFSLKTVLIRMVALAAAVVAMGGFESCGADATPMRLRAPKNPDSNESGALPADSSESEADAASSTDSGSEVGEFSSTVPFTSRDVDDTEMFPMFAEGQGFESSQL